MPGTRPPKGASLAVNFANKPAYTTLPIAPVSSVRLPTAPNKAPFSPGRARVAMTDCTAGKHMAPIDTMKMAKMNEPGAGASPAPANPTENTKSPVRIAFCRPK